VSAAPQPVTAEDAATTGVLPRPRPARTGRLLVVHDDPSIRLRLADLLSLHYPEGRVDTCSESAAASIGQVVRDYTAALVIVNFESSTAEGDPLAIVGRLRAAARAGAVIVLGRNGDERSAVRALRVGAADYWPLHRLDAAELIRSLGELALHGDSMPPGAAAGPAVAPPEHITLNLPGFRILKELARSTGAALYLAESTESGEPLALKVHRHRSATDASTTERERFVRECKLLSQFNHRSVADVHDFGVTDDFHWLAMEYFPCGSLKVRLQNPVTEAEALNYMTSIAHALISIHAAGIVHRDLKPSNIMLRADDSLALIDFGLARPALTASAVTAPNVRVGSPLYMAPEQIEGLPPDARCDLYALGVIFHELLTGQVPYGGDSVAAVLAQHRRKAPPQLAESLARYQPLLDALRAKRPEDRLESAEAVLKALASLGGKQAWWSGA
jgi:DNA-binding NarL/FixJ family response regulator